jgi:membrane protease YdiL (CAAX protease family)
MLSRKILLFLELSVLFIALPAVLYIYRHSAGRLVIPIIILLTLYTLPVVVSSGMLSMKNGSGLRDAPAFLKSRLLFFAAGSLAGITAIWLYNPHMLFAFPRENTLLWVIVMFLYPLLSALPQEIIFRGFFFRRYSDILGRNALFALSGLLFGYAHIFYGNITAPLLTAAGGLLFARTYLTTGSLALTVLEHALWGNLLFTIGIGSFFYHGNIR